MIIYAFQNCSRLPTQKREHLNSCHLWQRREKYVGIVLGNALVVSGRLRCIVSDINARFTVNFDSTTYCLLMESVCTVEKIQTAGNLHTELIHMYMNIEFKMHHQYLRRRLGWWLWVNRKQLVRMVGFSLLWLNQLLFVKHKWNSGCFSISFRLLYHISTIKKKITEKNYLLKNTFNYYALTQIFVLTIKAQLNMSFLTVKQLQVLSSLLMACWRVVVFRSSSALHSSGTLCSGSFQSFLLA